MNGVRERGDFSHLQFGQDEGRVFARCNYQHDRAFHQVEAQTSQIGQGGARVDGGRVEAGSGQ